VPQKNCGTHFFTTKTNLLVSKATNALIRDAGLAASEACD